MTSPTPPTPLPARDPRASNALRHGLTTSTPVLPWEDGHAYAEHRQATIAALTRHTEATPAIALAAHAADLLWRLQRIADWERRIIARAVTTTEERSHEREEHDEWLPGRAAITVGDPDHLDRLARYETHLLRQLRLTLQTLSATQQAWPTPR